MTHRNHEFPLTQEQQDVVRTEAATLRVNAFSGTGKTATLVAFAQARPNRRMLYIAFNKAIQMEAAQRFPANVEARTCHSLAYRAVGHRYQHKPAHKLRPLDLIGPLKLGELALDQAYPLAFEVLETLNHFLASSEPEISRRMVSPIHREESGDGLAECTRSVWSLMCDPKKPLGMLHDGYLKLFQLSRPRLSGVDEILFDEAQDANPAMLDIVLHQGANKVFVGDRHQQIYGWRGAQNAMEIIDPTADGYLTRSFRFGPPIAQVANTLLSTYKGETVPVVGVRETGEIGLIQANRFHTIIARTNAGLFDEAAQRLQGNRKKRLWFAGGIQGYPFQRILDAWRLYAHRKDEMEDNYLRTFQDFEQMEQLANDLEEWELKQLCRVVHKYGHQIPRLIRKIQQNTVVKQAYAQVGLTTAHKSKGLEFDQVRLANDFPDLTEIPKNELNPEEVNLLYVAATRAIETLELNNSLQGIPGIASFV